MPEKTTQNVTEVCANSTTVEPNKNQMFSRILRHQPNFGPSLLKGIAVMVTLVPRAAS